MSKKKAVALIVPLALAGISFACSSSSGVGEKSPTNAAAPTNAAKPTNAATPAPPTTTAAAISGEVEPIFKAKCAVCHGADGKGQGNAPNIFEEDKHTAAEWTAFLKDPKSMDKDSKMPTPQLTDGERKIVADWLATAAAGHGGSGEKPAEKKDEKAEGMKKS